ncbi:MAG: glycosyltransferase family 39 protein [Bacteroidetes bacterium]|nr:glycosyltransferase family 39 protein [Bacteroidota bacterium]
MQFRNTRIQIVGILIGAFFLLGLEYITQPPLDHHSWRQTLTITIARNFLDNPNFFFPRMDIGGKTDGIMACEFPIFNYLLAGIFKLFGTHDWYGRLLNWSVSCAGLWFFYDIVRRCSNKRTALIALVAMMSSITFEYARKTMPDTFALSLVTMGVWFLWNYLEKQNPWHLAAGFVLATCGILSKIPFLILLTFLIIPFFNKENEFKPKRNVVLAMSVTAACVGWWYYYWMPYLLETYGNQLIWPVSLKDGAKTVLIDRANDSWRMLMEQPFHYRIPFLLSVMGLGLLWTGASARMKWFTAAYIALFFLFTLKTGIVFPTHEYYGIPLIPLLALLFGYFFDHLNWPSTRLWVVVVLLLAFGFYTNRRQAYNSFIREQAYVTALPAIMDRYTQPTDKIMVNTGQFNPFLMYWAHRKGWAVNADVPGKTDWMRDFKAEGLKYILLDRRVSNDPLPYELLYEDPNFRLYKP